MKQFRISGFPAKDDVAWAHVGWDSHTRMVEIRASWDASPGSRRVALLDASRQGSREEEALDLCRLFGQVYVERHAGRCFPIEMMTIVEENEKRPEWREIVDFAHDLDIAVRILES